MKSLRAYLVTMAALLVLLICSAAALLIHEVDRFGRAQAQEQLLGTARALSTAVDGELRRATSILQTIEASEALQRRDWDEVDDQARIALPGKDAWIVVTDRSGRQLVNTHLAKGAVLPSGSNPAWLWPILDTGRPRICDLTKGYIEPHIVCVDLPIRENGRTAYALSIIMRPQLFSTVIANQKLAEGDVAALLDRRGTVIWRNTQPDRFVGRPATADVRAAIASNAFGVRESRSLDGVRVLGAFSRSPLSGWTFITGVPLDVVRAGGLRAVSQGALAAALILFLSAALAWAVARRLSRAVDRLATASAPIRDGAGFAFQPSGLSEIDEVGRTLGMAIEAQRAGEERFKLAQEVGGIGAWDWDVVRDEGHVSETYKEMHGLSAIKGPLSMRQVLDVIHPEDLEGYLARLAAARGRLEPSTNEYRVVHPGGAIRWIAAKGRPVMDADGRYVRAVGVVRDITRDREAEHALRQLNEELEARVEARTAELRQTEEALRQSQKLESMGQLTGGVAHDFNNLLTPIVGSLDMLQRRGVGGEREQRLIGGALQSAEKAKTLVQRLLAFARRQPLQPVPVDLRALIGGMAELIASTSGPRIRLATEVAPDLPSVKADPNQIEMAILNLAVNARDAMPDGGTLTIAARVAETDGVEEAKLSPGRYVRLSVSDTGIGMDEATRSRSVEPFFSTKGFGKGTGLGLSMVYGFARQSGGAFRIESEIGVGTRAEIWLPRGLQAHDGPAAAVNDLADAGPARPLKILLVDDHEGVRATTAALLCDLGHAVIEAADGPEVLALLQRHPDCCDVLITDYAMPHVSGAEVIRQARNIRAGLPAIIITGYADAHSIARRPHDVAVLSKPFKPDQVVAALQTACTTDDVPPLETLAAAS